MPKKRPPSSAGGDDGDYEVGYGRPPTHSQFRPGQSGYPSGRRKGHRNLATDVKSTLFAPTRVTENGRTRTISTQEAALKRLREKALNGGLRAIELLIKVSDRFNNAADTALTEPLSADDRAILDDYRASLSGPVPTSSATAPLDAGPESPSDGDPENPSNAGPEKKGKK
jgi:hypothetical protein